MAKVGKYLAKSGIKDRIYITHLTIVLAGRKKKVKHIIPILVTLLLLSSGFVGVSYSIDDIEQSSMSTFYEGSLSGYVNNTSMNPIEGALVRVYFHGTYEENYTDTSGYYHVTNIPICNCTKNCTASKLGYKTEWVLLSIDGNTTHDFILTPLGNILYVGGLGPGNYTTIQAAINDASDGDTVFVYDGSSPYYENVIVDVSVNLIGENKKSTVIDGSWSGNTIRITKSSVAVANFSVVNSGQSIWAWGISVADQTPRISDIHIVDCVVASNSGGIRFNNVVNSSIKDCFIHNNSGVSIDIILSSAYILIENCTVGDNGCVDNGLGVPGGITISGKGGEGNWCLNISIIDCVIYRNYGYGIGLSIVKNADVHHNLIHDNNGSGIFVTGYSGPSYNVSIHGNIISGNRHQDIFNAGVYLQDCVKCVTIRHNAITSNKCHGIFLLRCSGHQIFENNLIDNQRNAFFINSKSKWKQNYWERPRLLPYPIRGALLYFIPWVQFD